MTDWKPTIELTHYTGMRIVCDVDENVAANVSGPVGKGCEIECRRGIVCVNESVAEVNALLDRARDPEWQRLKRIEANMLAFYDAWIAEDEEAKKSLWEWVVSNYSGVGVISWFPVDNLTIGLRNIRRQLASYDYNKSKREALKRELREVREK